MEFILSIVFDLWQMVDGAALIHPMFVHNAVIKPHNKASVAKLWLVQPVA
jgi:hypothetical protein